MVSYGPLISKKSKMWQWCSCPTNSLQPPYCNLMNMQGRIAVYQPIYRHIIAAYQAVDINVQYIFTYGQIFGHLKILTIGAGVTQPSRYHLGN